MLFFWYSEIELFVEGILTAAITGNVNDQLSCFGRGEMM